VAGAVNRRGRRTGRAVLAAVAFALAAPLCGVAVAQETPAGGVPEARPVGPAAQEVVAEVRVHGNHTTPDAQVMAIAGLDVGDVLAPATLEEVERRLHASRRFEAVQVRKRYRSLEHPTQVAIVIVVHERASVVAADVPLPGPLSRVRRSMMFLPILDYADGYGLTYGLRTTFVGALGRDGRVSVPLTWGGTKRAAVEAERTFARGPAHRVHGGAGVSRRENPHYEIDEDRREMWVGAVREIVRGVRAEVTAGVAGVTFGAIEDRVSTAGGGLALDTRADPLFPRHAVFARASLGAMAFDDGPTVALTALEGRGYLGLAGQSVLSGRLRYDAADRPLPPYARLLLGGADTVRGHRAGVDSGDRRLISSVELRVPVTSPMNLGRLGVSVFGDIGAAREHGEPFEAREFRKGVGAGVFLLTPVFQVSVDVARGIGSGTRLHVSSGVTF
jgi:outer membrane protein assembly factor BamA